MKKFIYIICLLIIVTLSFSSQASQWQVVGNIPHPVSGGEVVALDSFIVVLGGEFDSLGTAVNFVQIFHPGSNSWVFTAPLVENRYGFVADVYKDSVVVMCGGIWYPTINLFSMEMWEIREPIFNPSQIYNHDLNFGRVKFTGHIHNDDLYVIGGLPTPVLGDSLFFPYIAKYNIPSATIVNTFNATYSPGNLPYDQMSAIIGDEIYIFGGTYIIPTDEINRFNVNTNNYQSIGNLPGRRSAGEAVVHNNIIYIIGGATENNALNTVDIFNTANDSVWSGPSLNDERSELMAVNFNNSIYVFGGRNSNIQPVSTVEKLELVTSIHDENPNISKSFYLADNYPNPFNSSTKIDFILDRKSGVSLNVYTITGKHMKRIVQQLLPGGKHSYTWDGTDENYNSAASGVYIYQLKTATTTLSKKMILLR